MNLSPEPEQNELIGPQRVARDCVYLTAGSCGRAALANTTRAMSWRFVTSSLFRLFPLAQDGLDQSMDMPLTLGMGAPGSHRYKLIPISV